MNQPVEFGILIESFHPIIGPVMGNEAECGTGIPWLISHRVKDARICTQCGCVHTLDRDGVPHIGSTATTKMRFPDGDGRPVDSIGPVS